MSAAAVAVEACRVNENESGSENGDEGGWKWEERLCLRVWRRELEGVEREGRGRKGERRVRVRVRRMAACSQQRRAHVLNDVLDDEESDFEGREMSGKQKKRIGENTRAHFPANSGFSGKIGYFFNQSLLFA